jgi:hypothetical protein
MYRFRKLLEEECALTYDLNNLENKCDDWSQAVKPSLLKLPVRSVSKSYISNTDNIKKVSYKIAFRCSDFIVTVTITITAATIVTITIVLFSLPISGLVDQLWIFLSNFTL